MKTRVFLLFTICFMISCLYITGCVSTKNSVSQNNPEHIFTQSYDQVWKSLEDVILKDSDFLAKKVDKKKGIIETEWVYRIATEGTTRWCIKAKARRRKNEVRVLIEKIVESRDEVSREINKYRRESKEQKTEPHAGWRRGESDMNSIEELYLKVESKLKGISYNSQSVTPVGKGVQ